MTTQTFASIPTFTRKQLEKLAHEAKTRHDWQIIHDFAEQMYGPGKAAKVEIETEGQWDDESTTNYYVDNVTAWDKDGEELSPDFSLPFFQVKSWKHRGWDGEDEDWFSISYRDIWKGSKTDKEKERWVFYEDLPVYGEDGETYDLTVVPPLYMLS